MPKPVRVLYAWELGDNRGHIERGATLAIELRKRGHPVLFSVRNTAIAGEVLGPSGFHFQQAPIHLRNIPFKTGIASYADILLASGYDGISDLIGLLKAWMTTIALFGAEIIVADHAPSAIIAAKALGIPVVALGTGFEVPPPLYPYPAFGSGASVDALIKSHNAASENISSALSKLGCASSLDPRDIFADTPAFLTSYKPLDHYSSRLSGRYIGPIDASSAKIKVRWPTGHKKCIFTYLHDGPAFLRCVFDALERVGASAICVCPNADVKPKSADIIVMREPVDLNPLLASVDLSISNAGAGLIAQCAKSGIPMLLAPRYAEQELNACRLIEAGSAKNISVGSGREIERAINIMLLDNSFKIAAVKLAKTLELTSEHSAVELVARHIESVAC